MVALVCVTALLARGAGAEYVPNDALSHTATPGATAVLVPAGQEWAYWGSGPLPAGMVGTGAWRQPGFNDAEWPRGPGVLGYAIGDATFGTNLTRLFVPANWTGAWAVCAVQWRTCCGACLAWAGLGALGFPRL